MMKTITYMKIRHHSLFKSLESDNIDWNIIRNDPLEEDYYIPTEKNKYIEDANTEKMKMLSNEILNYLKRLNIKNIFSLGSGRCYVEYHLKQSFINVIVSDSDDSINRIKEFKIFDNVYNLNFEKIMSKTINFNGLILLSRIDTEIDDFELKELFNNLAANNVNYIYFIPAQLLTIKSFLIEIYIRLKSLVFRKKLIFCGFSRSEKLFNNIWKKHYKILYKSDAKNFLLVLK